MYRALVKRLARKGLGNFNRDDYERIARKFASDGLFFFAGNHALSGECRGPDGVRAWFRRAFRLFPDLRLEPQTIAVSGWPWNTVVATHFTVRATLPDGGPYANAGMQLLRLRFGRVVEDRIYEDTQKLARVLDEIAAQRAGL